MQIDDDNMSALAADNARLRARVAELEAENARLRPKPREPPTCNMHGSTEQCREADAAALAAGKCKPSHCYDDCSEQSDMFLESVTREVVEMIRHGFRAGYASGVEDSKPKWRPMSEAPKDRDILLRFADGDVMVGQVGKNVVELAIDPASEWTEIPR